MAKGHFKVSGPGAKHGSDAGWMICNKCKKEISESEDYLVQDKYGKGRGNEGDKRFLYHRECSQTNPIWEAEDTAKELRKRKDAIFEKALEKVQRIVEVNGIAPEDIWPEIEYRY